MYILIIIISNIFYLNSGFLQLKINDSWYFFNDESYSELHITDNKIYFITEFFDVEIYDYRICDDSIKLFRGNELSRVINIVKHDDNLILEEGIYKYNLFKIDRLNEVENIEKLYQDYLKRKQVINIDQKDI
ncbi:MAG: hypothetical protein ACOCWM_03140 [Cyclobacteriaceae bacterium]